MTEQSPPSPPKTPSTSVLAVLSLVFGLIGVLSSFFAPLVAAILAVVFGHIARSEIAKDPQGLTGSGLALAGLILGYAGLAFSLIGMMFWSAMFLGLFGFLWGTGIDV